VVQVGGNVGVRDFWDHYYYYYCYYYYYYYSVTSPTYTGVRTVRAISNTHNRFFTAHRLERKQRKSAASPFVIYPWPHPQ